MNGTLLVEDLVKTFRGTRAVDSISFAVSRGSFTALLGPNGSGKSTTLKLCTNMLQPDSGRVLLNGIDVAEDTVEALSDVGCVIESPEIYPDVTARRYLDYLGKISGMTAEDAKSETERVLGIVGMSDSRSDRRIGSYSKGMKQRIVLAQSLLGDPEVLILDEPTSGLDPKGSAEFNSILKKLNREGKTILMSSHMLHEVEGLCDSAVIIDCGRTVRRGAMEEIIRRSTVMISVIGQIEKETISMVSRIPGVIEVGSSGNEMSIRIDGGPELQAELVKTLTDSGIRVYSVCKKDPLEEVFMDVTGGNSR
ncbi:hypothetical protein AUQ37_06250 [Candidatus Methanomethylophilus sp. 1R26]|uniref:ABC transporter ATP-binding protein n=1 Tax=Candidatus Methanomethylophilus sp. 1R26 TaxID=1769296 RepID=UPI0007375A6A|nr:ABC transporter ATP-binding protein [Candidatus Methanomethylophilus sp. 1R26]KUE74064.1 hypothetical protein AUQ37_06250 [Candidatus Methanomethylophilus sp. 1R26]